MYTGLKPYDIVVVPGAYVDDDWTTTRCDDGLSVGGVSVELGWGFCVQIVVDVQVQV